MSTLNLGLMEDAALAARLSRQPLVHVALAVALQDLGGVARVHRYKISLQDPSGQWTETPGLAIEHEGKILSLEGGEGWQNIEQYEKDFNSIVFKELTGIEPVAARFEHEQISEERFEKMRKKVQVESASMFAVLSEMVENKLLTIPQKQAKVFSP